MLTVTTHETNPDRTQGADAERGVESIGTPHRCSQRCLGASSRSGYQNIAVVYIVQVSRLNYKMTETTSFFGQSVINESLMFMPQDSNTPMSVHTLEQVFEDKRIRKSFIRFVLNTRDIYPWEWLEIKKQLNLYVLRDSADENVETRQMLKAALHIYEMVTELREASPGAPFQTKEFLLCSAEKHIRKCAKHFACDYRTEMTQLLRLINKLRKNKFQNNMSPCSNPLPKPQSTLYLSMRPMIPNKTSVAGCAQLGGAREMREYHNDLVEKTEFLVAMVTPILNLQLKAFIRFSNRV